MAVCASVVSQGHEQAHSKTSRDQYLPEARVGSESKEQHTPACFQRVESLALDGGSVECRELHKQDRLKTTTTSAAAHTCGWQADNVENKVYEHKH